MASRLIVLTCLIALGTVALPPTPALAALLDEQGESEAKEASRLYKQGRYEEAAAIFAKLSVAYPDLLVFERNLGACFYHLRQPEPALANLRRYLARKQNITPDDKAVVDRWLAEMEELRAQSTSPEVVPARPGEAVSPTSATTLASTALEPMRSPPPTAALAPSAKPAGVDFAASAGATPPAPATAPFYRTWWFWSGTAAILAGGTVTALWLANRSNAGCDGSNRTCLGVK